MDQAERERGRVESLCAQPFDERRHVRAVLDGRIRKRAARRVGGIFSLGAVDVIEPLGPIVVRRERGVIDALQDAMQGISRACPTGKFGQGAEVRP